ncbi:MAG: AsmA family protein [Pseudomonadota bacterium]
MDQSPAPAPAPDSPRPAAARKPLSRRAKILLGVAGVVVAVPAVALVVLLNYDWNKARPWLNAKTSEAIGRPFTITGPLALTWDKTSLPAVPGESSWRDAIPWPHLVAQDVHVGNPAGMGAGDMASVKQFAFSLNPFSLLNKRISIPQLQFEAPVVSLQRRADGSNNWTFKPANKDSPWRLELEQVVFTKGVVRLQDAVKKADITAQLETLSGDQTYGVGWTARGSYNGAPMSGNGKAGAVLSLKQQTTPFPLKADVRMGSTRIGIEGTLTKPTALAALDLELKLAGASMAQLYALTGLLLPETPPYRTEGRLLAQLEPGKQRWSYEKFKGKVGGSDIGGKLVFESGKPRGRLSGDVVSNLLQFSDLGPLIGADSNASKAARGGAPVQPAGKLLPVETFRTERWSAIDVDVKFAAERIMREKQLPIKKLSTHLVLKDGVLTLAPLRFDMAGGTLVSNIELDGSGRQGKNAIRAKAKVTARRLELKQMFPTIEKLQATVGTINGDAQLSALGNSVATLLAGANGEIKASVSQGTVSKMLLEQAGLNIGNVVLTKMFGDRPVKLNCLVTDFGVRDGLMQTRTFVVDTEEALITADGTINLATEQVNLTLKPETRNIRIFSLRAPLYVRGPFSKPTVEVDKRVLAMKAGGAVALAALAAPLAALLPLVNTGPGQKSACGQLLAEAKVKPVAPPPGKHAKRR